MELKFGLIPEFMGRLPMVGTLGDLDEGSDGEIQIIVIKALGPVISLLVRLDCRN
jgi:ATP-dependent protease Clp ATPase subunit